MHFSIVVGCIELKLFSFFLQKVITIVANQSTEELTEEAPVLVTVAEDGTELPVETQMVGEAEGGLCMVCGWGWGGWGRILCVCVCTLQEMHGWCDIVEVRVEWDERAGGSCYFEEHICGWSWCDPSGVSRQSPGNELGLVMGCQWSLAHDGTVIWLSVEGSVIDGLVGWLLGGLIC